MIGNRADEPRYCLCSDPEQRCTQPIPGFMCRPRKPSPDAEWNHRNHTWETAVETLAHRFAVLSATLEGERKAWSHEQQQLQSDIEMLRGELTGAANEVHLVLETLKAQRDRGVMVIPAQREPWRKKACEGGGTLTNCADNFHECLYCGCKVAADLVDHAVFGFASVCPEKRP